MCQCQALFSYGGSVFFTKQPKNLEMYLAHFIFRHYNLCKIKFEGYITYETA